MQGKPARAMPPTAKSPVISIAFSWKSLFAPRKNRRAGTFLGLFALATYHSESDAADKEFREAQKSLWTGGFALEGPDTDALRAKYRTGVHFNGKGLQAHGQAWADKVSTWLDKQLEK